MDCQQNEDCALRDPTSRASLQDEDIFDARRKGAIRGWVSGL